VQQALALLVVCACAPPPRAPDASDQINALASAALRDGDAVGISIAIAHGEFVDSRAFGFADREHKVAMSPYSIVPLASLSKQYWAAAAVTRPGFDPDAKLSAVLPGFPDNGTRVRDVFQHTSGLGDDHDGEDDEHFTDLPPPAFPPGTWWQYSNRGALLAKRLAGPVEACGEHVPLYDHGKRTNGVSDETWRRVQFVCSNVLDVVKFERALDAPEYALLRQPVVIDGIGELPYGMLTRIADLDGHRAYGHTGNFPGVSVAAFRFPAEDLTIVVLMNSSPRPGFHAPDLLEKIARLELHVPEAPATDPPPPPELLADIAGDYATPGAHGTIDARAGRAHARITAGSRVIYDGPLAWRGGRTFDGGGQHDTFLPATGRARAVAAGSTFMLEALAGRSDP
jgi:CubicO group peptidase (beta-lactamase class C family)